MGCSWEICFKNSFPEKLNYLQHFLQPEIKIQQGGHIPQLDGLRGIAILMVICYHFFPGNIACNFGWTGVDLFFVLSGFLITGRLLPYLDERKLLVRFYRNRFLRIVPLYFAFLILFFAGWFLLSSKQTLSSFGFYGAHWWQFFLFIQNWVFANNLVESKTHLQHLWSIAVEEQIYLLFPLFLIVVRNKTKVLYAVIFMIITILISRWYYFSFMLQKEAYLKIYLNTFFRLDSFLCGVLVYLIYNDRKIYRRLFSPIPWLTLLCALVLFLYIVLNRNAEKNNAFISGGGYTIIALMYAGLLMLTLLKKYKIINLVTSLSFLRFTGKISYGMYIFHWPIFLSGFILLNKLSAYLKYSLDNNTIHFINVVICLPATYLLSSLSYKFFESYFLKKKISKA